MELLARESPYHLQIERAEGCFVYDNQGTAYLDASAGLWNVSVGHGRGEVIAAIAEQLKQLTYVCNISIRSQLANQLAMRLLEHAPAQLERVMLHCTGTAAVEGAVMLCRQYFKLIGQPARAGVISVEQSYHGCSLLGVTVSGCPDDARWFEPLPEGFYHIPAPDGSEAARRSIAALEALIAKIGKEKLAAFVFEPILGVAGVIEPPAFWTEQILELCHQHGIKVVSDEVTTGLGRTGAWFACSDTRIDAIALGKGISGGYMPLAAVLYHGALFEPFHQPGGRTEFKYGSTMDGCPAACAAGLAVLDILERESLIAAAGQRGASLRSKLQPLLKLPIVGSIHGRGLMLGLTLHEPQNPAQPLRPLWMEKILGRLITAGVLTHSTGSSHLTILPPLTISEAELDLLAETLTSVLTNFCARFADWKESAP